VGRIALLNAWMKALKNLVINRAGRKSGPCFFAAGNSNAKNKLEYFERLADKIRIHHGAIN
jgi:coenzyme F420-reducing hydrogenase delta subunit